MTFDFRKVLLLCTIFLEFFNNVQSQDKYTEKEKILLTQFRELMVNVITKDYMQENKYLIRFLRARDLNLKDAEKLILENLKWRKDFDIDNILRRDFSRYEKAYPLFYSFDKTGRPAVSLAIGVLNPRQILLNGKQDELRDYFLYLFERGVQRMHKVSNDTGKEFISSYMVADMAGYNIRAHGCLLCIQGWIEIAQTYERHYPQLAYKVIIVNTPRIFESIFQVLKPLIKEHTQHAIKIYGYNRDEWSKVLFKFFDKDQLLTQFGGSAKPPYRLPY